MYIHIPKEKRTKLDPSRKKGIFVGYSGSSKAYRIYFSGFKKIDINRDITFDQEIRGVLVSKMGLLRKIIK